MSRAQAMVISSRMEGGANVVSEAIMAGLPVIASKIDGNMGLLGGDYDGYYRVEDEAALAQILARFEEDGPFLLNVMVTREECVYPMVPAGGALEEMILGPRKPVAVGD